MRFDGWYGQTSDSRLQIIFVQAFEGIALLVSRATAKIYDVILTPDSYCVSLSFEDLLLSPSLCQALRVLV